MEEAAPPASVATWLPKKYFSSKVPRGVAMYFCVVTREIVLSCRPSVVGDLAQHQRPHRHLAVLEECRCRSTIACDTRRMVSKRCCTFLISQRASCSCDEMLAAAAARRCGELGVQAVDAQPRHGVGVEARAPDALAALRTITSGTT